MLMTTKWVWMIHPTSTTELENQQDSILSAISAALVPIHSIAWKTAQHFSYGARGFMRVPVSEANDLNFLLCVATQAAETDLVSVTSRIATIF
jgi:hypothetical protein